MGVSATWGLKRDEEEDGGGEILLLLPPQTGVKSQVSLVVCGMGTRVVASRLVCEDRMSLGGLREDAQSLTHVSMSDVITPVDTQPWDQPWERLTVNPRSHEGLCRPHLHPGVYSGRSVKACGNTEHAFPF